MHTEASFSWRPLEAEWSKASTLPDERWGGTLTSIEPDKVQCSVLQHTPSIN